MTSFKNIMRTAVFGAAATTMVFAQTTPSAASETNGQATVQQHARAGFRHGKRGRQGRFYRELIANYINLSQEQRAGAKKIFQASRESAKPIHVQLRETRTQLRAAIQAGKPVDNLAATEGKLMGQLVAIRANAREQFLKTLTPEETQKLHQLFANSRSAHHAKPSNG